MLKPVSIDDLIKYHEERARRLRYARADSHYGRLAVETHDEIEFHERAAATLKQMQVPA
jgi:hypothetical protein